MKKLLVHSLVLAIICIIAEASFAEQYWAKNYFFIAIEQKGNFISQTVDGGYIILGESYLHHRLPLIQKLDSNGDISWGKSGPFVSSVMQTLDSGYIAAGYSFYLDWSNWVVMKLDQNGTVSWRKVMEAMESGIFSNAGSIQQTSDSGYIAAGSTNAFGAGDHDIWVVKLNNNGDVLWQKSYGGSGYDSGGSIQQTTDGGYIMSGSTRSFGAGGIDAWLFKFNSDGTIAWQKTLGGSGYDYCSIQQTTDGGYVLAGSTDSFGGGDRDIWVVKLNNNGDVLWQKSYGGSGYDSGGSIQQTTDGGYIMSGYTNSFGAGGNDAWLFKLNSDGTIAWQKTIGGSGSDYAGSIKQTTDGGYVFAGSTPDSYQVMDVEALWVMKIDSNGEIPNCTFTISPSNAIITDIAASTTDTTVTGQLTSATINSESVALEDYPPIGVNTVCCYDSDDYDSDTHGNACDNCPDVANEDQLNSDSDEYGDACDNCPHVDNEDQANGDYDNLGDACDNCPLNTNEEQENDDGDSYGNVCDNCPTVTNEDQADSYPPGGNDCGDACECEGNFNPDADDDVDGTDAASFKADFGRGGYNSPCTESEPCNGNFDCDSDVDGSDSAIFKADFGRGGYNNPCPACVTEPWCIEYINTCLNNFDCPLASYCEKPIGQCDIVGECVERSSGICPTIYAPVCGCDGITYSNDCYAAGAGISIDYLGACTD